MFCQRELNKLLGIKVAASTAYHPQTDGQTEWVYQEIEQYLRLFINQRQDDWLEWISLAEFAYNNRVHSSTQFSVVLLRPYEEDPIVERHSLPPPPPIIRDRIQEYEVEKILDSRIFHGRLEYLVRWKGYGAAEDLWVPTQDVTGAKRLVREFHRLNPEAPQRISASLYASFPSDLW